MKFKNQTEMEENKVVVIAFQGQEEVAVEIEKARGVLEKYQKNIPILYDVKNPGESLNHEGAFWILPPTQAAQWFIDAISEGMQVPGMTMTDTAELRHVVGSLLSFKSKGKR